MGRQRGNAPRPRGCDRAGHDTAQVSEQMLDEYEVDRDQLASEAVALLASLQQEGLVSSGE